MPAARARPDPHPAGVFWTRALRAPSSTLREELYEELASLLQAGISVRVALDSLAPPGAGRAGVLVDAWRESVERGEGLAEGMLRRPDLIDPVEAVMLRAGERAGRLVHALRAAAARLAAARAARRTVLMKVAYPFLVLHVALLLPTIPTVLIPRGAAAWLGLVLVGLVALWGAPLVLVTVWAAARHSPTGAARLARLPVVGTALHAAAAARFAEVLGMLHEAGEGADVALEEAGLAASGWFLARLDGAVARVRGGESLHSAVSLLPAVPPEVLGLLDTGERSGAIAEHMARAARLCSERAERAAWKAAVLAGGLAFALAVLAVIAAIVAVLGPIYGPLFEMTR